MSVTALLFWDAAYFKDVSNYVCTDDGKFLISKGIETISNKKFTHVLAYFVFLMKTTYYKSCALM